jgi:phage shock protein PspC (stress-responsive transcriptional regulator)
MQVNPRQLYRSDDDRIFAGVAGGLAAYLDVDPVIVRIIWLLSMFVTGSLTFWVYVIMMVVVPLEPTEWPPQSPWAPGGEPLGYQAGYTPPPPGTATANDASSPSAAPAASASGQPPTAAPGGWWSNDWRWQRRADHWQRRAERRQQRAERYEYHSYGGPGLVFGLLLVLIGGMLAWHQLDPNFDLNLTWPILIIAFGAILVASSFRFRDRS